jgi:predicted metal-dependent hydrolase
MFRRIYRRIRKSCSPASKREYLLHKEPARKLVVERLTHFHAEYTRLDPLHSETMKYRRLTIRNQRSRWGSCSSKKNLNFNYRILHLSSELRDYVIVHEMCHLKELHHRESFWKLMELVIPNARELNNQARSMKLS